MRAANHIRADTAVTHKHTDQQLVLMLRGFNAPRHQLVAYTQIACALPRAVVQQHRVPFSCVDVMSRRVFLDVATLGIFTRAVALDRQHVLNWRIVGEPVGDGSKDPLAQALAVGQHLFAATLFANAADRHPAATCDNALSRDKATFLSAFARSLLCRIVASTAALAFRFRLMVQLHEEALPRQYLWDLAIVARINQIFFSRDAVHARLFVSPFDEIVNVLEVRHVNWLTGLTGNFTQERLCHLRGIGAAEHAEITHDDFDRLTILSDRHVVVFDNVHNTLVAIARCQLVASLHRHHAFDDDVDTVFRLRYVGDYARCFVVPGQ